MSGSPRFDATLVLAREHLQRQVVVYFTQGNGTIFYAIRQSPVGEGVVRGIYCIGSNQWWPIIWDIFYPNIIMNEDGEKVENVNWQVEGF